MLLAILLLWRALPISPQPAFGLPWLTMARSRIRKRWLRFGAVDLGYDLLRESNINQEKIESTQWPFRALRLFHFDCTGRD